VQTIADEISIQSQQLASPNQPSLVYRRVLEVYNELAAFYTGTIKRRVLPCPKQYKSSEQFDEDIAQFYSIYDNTFKSTKWLEGYEEATNDEKQLILSRSDSILKQFLRLIEEDKHSLTIKWSRNLNHLQVHKHLPATTSS
jgi:hypothetical protein